MAQLNSPDHFLILGGPKDGEQIRLEPGRKTLTVMILHPPPILAAMAADEVVKASKFDYVTKTVLVGTAWLEILVPAFWSDAEVLMTLAGHYRPDSVIGLRP